MTLQQEKELLVGVVTKLAAKLIKQGGFVPFGATLGPGRNVKLFMPKDWKENATRDELETYWSRELRKAVNDAECKTVCSCADVRLPIDNGNLVPCIFIHIEQAPRLAEDIAYPYMKDGDSEVKLGAPTTVQTEPRIFSTCHS